MVAVLLPLLVVSAAPEPIAPAPTARELTAWVQQLADKDVAARDEATTKLVKAGPLAKGFVPELMKLLDAPEARTSAVAVLGAIGPDAKAAVPALVALLPRTGPASGYTTEGIATALLRIAGPVPEATRALLISSGKCQPIYLQGSQALTERPVEVVGHVVALCADKDKQVRVRAATVLGELKTRSGRADETLFDRAGASTKGIPAALEKLLSDEEAEVRLAAANAISRVAPELSPKTVPVVVAVALDGAHAALFDSYHAASIFAPAPKDAAKALIPLFDHTSERVRGWAVNAMSDLPARDPLESALKNAPTANGRAGAATALGARYADGADSLPALTAALKDREFEVRFAAARAVVHVSTRDHAGRGLTVPVFVEGCRNKSERVRTQAAQYLNSIGAAAKSAAPSLQALLADTRPDVRTAAAYALVELDPTSASGAVPVLIAVLKTETDDDPHGQTLAAQALAQLGPTAKAGVPELVRLFDAKNPHVRLQAASAAARIAPEWAPKATEVLVQLLKEPKNKRNVIRSNALAALINIGTGAKDARPALAELLADDGRFHGSVALAMIRIDAGNAKAAYDWLRNELRTPKDDDVVLERLPTLGKLAAPLLTELVALLKSKDSDHRRCAVRTLGAIGPDAKLALPDLKKLIETDPSPENRESATDAVKKIEAR